MPAAVVVVGSPVHFASERRGQRGCISTGILWHRMTEVIVGKVVSSSGRSEASLETALGSRLVYFATEDAQLADTPDPYVLLALLAAMKTGRPLRSVSPVAFGLQGGLAAAQDVLKSFHPYLHRVSVDIAERPVPDKASQVGCFFSGGVDSFYTLLKHRSEITSLILVHGFDFSLDERRLRTRTSEAARDVAATLGMHLIEVETNARAFTDEIGPWGDMCHGAALASVAHALTPQLSKVYIASSYTYADIFPWGSHPLLDRHWSSTAIEIVHDGCEATRVEKVKAIAAHDIALRHLRVCLRTSPEWYNCGKCEKCVRTMLNLELAGALHRCATLPRLDLTRVTRLPASNHGARTFLQENYQAAIATGADPELTEALRQGLSGRYERGIWALLRKAHSATWPQHPQLAEAVDALLHGKLRTGISMLVSATSARIASFFHG